MSGAPGHKVLALFGCSAFEKHKHRSTRGLKHLVIYVLSLWFYICVNTQEFQNRYFPANPPHNVSVVQISS